MRLTILFCLISPLLSSVPCGTHLPKAHESNRFKRFVIGGNNVRAVGKWPWQVLVAIQDSNSTQVASTTCGGTVISENWILTAGHCVRSKVNSTFFYDEKKIGVLLALTSINRLENMKAVSILGISHALKRIQIKINVTQVIPYPYYTEITKGLDIALLKLEKPLTFDEKISPICLPKYNQSIPSDGYAVAIGFGNSNYRGTNKIRDFDLELREVILPIIERDTCNLRLAEDNTNVPKEITIKQFEKLQLICAGSMGHAVNHGDSGGPLMMKAEDGRWFQVGITSFGSRKHVFDADVSPNAFTDIRPYCGWIETTTDGEASCEKEEVTLEDVEIHM